MPHKQRYCFLFSILGVLVLTNACYKQVPGGPFAKQKIDIWFNVYDSTYEYCFLDDELVELWQAKDTLIVTGHRKNREVFRFQFLYDSIRMPQDTWFTLSQMENTPQTPKHIPGSVRIDFSGWSFPFGIAEFKPTDTINFRFIQKDSDFVAFYKGSLTLDGNPINIEGDFYGKRQYR